MGTDLASDGNPLPEGEYASTRYDPFVPDTEANNTFRHVHEEYDARYDGDNADGAYRAVYCTRKRSNRPEAPEASALEEFTGMEHAGPVGDYQFSETNQATVSSIWGTVSYDEEWESNVLDP